MPDHFQAVSLTQHYTNKLLNMYHMTFTEEEEKNPSELSVWVNNTNMVYMEIQPSGGSNDPYEHQCIVLCKSDVIKLAEELNRLAKAYELKD